MDKKEVSKSGNPIITHKGAPQKFDDIAPPVCSEEISAHMEKYIGPIKMVFHEIVSEGVHLDVNWVAPTERYPFHVLVTMGMSDRPMNVPKELEKYAYAELFVVLPASWPLTTEAFKDEQNYWPVRLLKDMARFPHWYNTWLGLGHTVPNGNPPEPYAKNTSFNCALILYPLPFPVEIFELRINAHKTIHFYSVVPLYPQEVDFKLDRGLDPLTDLFEQYQVTSLIDIHRPNVVTGTRPVAASTSPIKACPRCTQVLPATAKFCNKCGQKF